MPCSHPLTGWRSRQVEPSGKRKIVFNRENGYADMEVKIPCGQCIQCRLGRSREWAVRCVHEAQLHEENCFITLTYNNENLPKDGGLVKKDYQDFMKRFRKEIEPRKIRYYHCGEYGSVRDDKGNVIPNLLGRPHYHAIIFGYQFPDLELHREKKGIKLYRSEKLERLWSKGFVTVGEVTFHSAAYVARYVMKKKGGEMAQGDESTNHYVKPDEYGELHLVQPEYTTMSRRPGIAHDWFMEFKDDLKKDFITINKGEKVEKFKPPKYYDGLFEIHEPDHLANVKAKRKAHAKNDPDNSLERLAAKEAVKKAQVKMLIREYEEQ
jgi:hypothetical protein